ncbi:hypothetical protein R6Z07F_000344 [Ovis aries]
MAAANPDRRKVPGQKGLAFRSIEWKISSQGLKVCGAGSELWRVLLVEVSGSDVSGSCCFFKGAELCPEEVEKRPRDLCRLSS